MVTVVRRLGTPSSASTLSSQSPSIARSFRLKRVGVLLRVAPRPRIDSTGILSRYASRRTYQEQTPADNRRRLGLRLENDDQDDDKQNQAAESDVHSRSSYQTISDCGEIGSRELAGGIGAARREGRPAMLGHRAQGRRFGFGEPLVDPHVAEHRGHIKARFPIRNALDPQQG